MEHKFGGRWTEAKLGALRDYLVAYTQALKNKAFTLHYIDAFAGSGSFVPVQGDGVARLGSAQIALEVAGFHRYHFIEKQQKRCRSLHTLAAGQPKGKISIHLGDANEHLSALCAKVPWKGARAVLFLDPYGMQVEWSTLQLVAATGAIDVWYLFPLSGVTRQLTRNEDRMDDDKRRSLDRVLGTTEWREALYSRSPDLFGGVSSERHATSEGISEWITERLKTLFPVVEGPVILRKGSRGDPGGGPPLFALYLLVSSPNPQAQAVARRIGKGVMGKLIRESLVRRPIAGDGSFFC